MTEAWTDGEGIVHHVVITPRFLLAHMKLQRSLISDMEVFGPEGRVLVDRTLLEQREESNQVIPFRDALARPDSMEDIGS